MRLYILPFILFLSLSAVAQDTANKWTLRKAVDYAVSNNLVVRQADIQRMFADVDLHQSKMTKIPTLTGNLFSGYSFGLAENRTTGTLSSADIFQAQAALQTNYTIFNWFSRKNNIEANKLALQAAKAGIEKAQNDISLSVANTFLQAMLGHETIGIAQVQLDQTREQLRITNALVNAGTVPELNSLQLQAQLALDSANLIQAQSSYRQALIQLKTLLHLPQDTTFDIVIPPVELIPVESLADLEPAYVYNLALTNQPLQRVNQLRLQQAGYQVKAARGLMYPSVFAQAGVNTTYANLGRRIVPGAIPVFEPSGGKVVIGTSSYDVYFPSVPTEKSPFFSQLRSNFGQNIGLGVSFNIFNQHQLRSQWQRTKIQVQQYELQQLQDNASLQSDIYNAYELAVTALQKYNASVRQVQVNEKAMLYANRRNELGLINVLDLITTQNNLFRSRIEMVRNRYDFVFKMKVLEFYKGNGIKL